MNDRSPFESYLTGRAADIDVPGAGTTAIAARARARRRRRRAGGGAVLGVAVLLTGAVAGQGLRSDDDAQELSSYGAGIVDPALDWTTVDVEQGLGWTYGMVQADSGALYGLSTAPGPDDEAFVGRSLYRSEDGTDWSEVALPGGLRANGVAADGDTIFAVGTSSAGGGVQVASSATPGADWSVSDLPLDLEAEADAAGLPGRYFVSETSLAVHEGRTVVAVNLGVDIDSAEVLPDEPSPDTWYATERGMEQYNEACATGEDPSAPIAPTTTAIAGTPSADDPATERPGASGADGSSDVICDDGREETIVRTWAELGYDPTVGSLVGGRNHVFASDDAGGFEPVAVVDRVQASAPSVLAGPDGFWILTPEYRDTDQINARYSPDGMDWSAGPVVLSGSMIAAGLLDGQPHVLSLDWATGGATLFRLGTSVAGQTDLSETFGFTADGTRTFGAASFGPLGLVVSTTERGEDGPGRSSVLHTADGVGFSRTEVPTAPDGMRQVVNGITMSADAVKVRLNLYEDSEEFGTEPSAQRLLVGTPR